jgi:pilus assembly protein CpaD
MSISTKHHALAALALPLLLAACGSTGGGPSNATLYSVHQPVVERHDFTLDLVAGAGGLSVPEQARLADWFEAMDVGYGDRIAIDDPVNSPATREDVAALAGRHSLLLAEGAPVTEGHVAPGRVRVVVTRSSATVPGCPDWNNGLRTSLGNRTSPGYGCAINSNLAAMVADPEHLLEGAHGNGETMVSTSTRAIEAYREGSVAAPAGGGTGN